MEKIVIENLEKIKDYIPNQELLDPVIEELLSLDLARDTLKANLRLIHKFRRYLYKWQKQLSQDGLNTKTMVKNDIQYLLKKFEE